MAKKDPTKPGIVYAIADISELDRYRYIGRTVLPIADRIRSHWYFSRTGRAPLQNWLRKRSPSDVEFKILSHHPNVRELNDAEIKSIAFYRGLGMADLNLTDGGEGALGISKSESWREAHRNAVKRGEDHCWSKLNWDQVRTIRNLRSVQYVPDRDLAVQYGVSHQTISDVLHNEVWKDPDYDSSAVIRDSSGENAHNVRMTWGSVREVRTIRQREYRTLKNLAEGYNVSPDMIRLILLNKNWIDPNYDPSKMVSR